MKVNRILRVAFVMFLVVALLLPISSARFIGRFSFSLGQANTNATLVGINNPNVVATGGFDVVHAATHLFYPVANTSGITRTNTLTRTMEIHREGWYAFAIRGGDGGSGRGNTPTTQNHANNIFGSAGGAGGMVMGYVWLSAGTTLYIELATAGRGWNNDYGTANRTPHWGGGIGRGRGGEGGGSTILSTAQTVWPAGLQTQNTIAVAGGGGGGGGLGGGHNNPWDQNGRGGNAGGAGNAATQTGTSHANTPNPVLNGYNPAPPASDGTVPHSMGRVSPGVRGGNPTHENITKNTARPLNVGSNGGGGGGGAIAGGQAGIATNPAASVGGVFSGGIGTAWGGGGGSGWFGGGGGNTHTGANEWNGGGGGGSSFVRSDVRPLTSAMLASGYFGDLLSLTNVRDQSGAPRFRYNINTEAARVFNTNYIQNLRLQGTGGAGAAANIPGDLPGNNTGWNGFAFIMYLGPQDPALWNHGNTFNTWLAN